MFRSLFLSLVFGAASLGLIAATPAHAQARWWNRGWRSAYYYPGYYTGYYSPGYYGSYSYPAYSSYYYPAYTSSYYTPAYTSSYYTPGYTSFYAPAVTTWSNGPFYVSPGVSTYTLRPVPTTYYYGY